MLPTSADRIYVVVRAGMPTGLMGAQAIHAARMFPTQRQEPTVVLMSCPEDRFKTALDITEGHAYVWREPDQGDAPTAMCLADQRLVKQMVKLLGVRLC